MMEIRERNAIQDIKTRDRSSVKKKWQPPVKQMVAKRLEEVSLEDKGETAVDQVEQATATVIDETTRIITPHRRKEKRGKHRSGRASHSEIKMRQSAAKFIVGRANNREAVVPTRPMRRIQQTTQITKKATKTVSVLTQKFADAVTKAASAMTGAFAGVAGGVVLLIVLCAVVIIAAVAASPFGIFFADEPQPGAIPLSEAIAQINAEFEARLAELQAGDYDSVVIEGEPPDWREVVAVFAVKIASGDDAEIITSLSEEQVEELRTVFWDMVEVVAEIRTSELETGTRTECRLAIKIRSAGEMRVIYSFSEQQGEMLDELLKERVLDDLLTDLSVLREGVGNGNEGSS